MLSVVEISLILLNLITFLSILGYFWLQNRKSNEISYVLEQILMKPDNLEILGTKIGQSFHKSMSMASRGRNSGYARKVKKFRALFFDKLIPESILDKLPFGAGDMIKDEPMLIGEAMRLYELYTKDKPALMKEVVNIISKGLGGDLDPSKIINDRLEKVEDSKSED